MGTRPWEVRIHGVAGTPPAQMLQLEPARPAGTLRDAEPPAVAVYAQPPHDDRLRALSWSSLTSGAWHTALYILLAPFMLVNVAGWTLPEGERGREDPLVRWRLLLVRLVALGVTAQFSALTFIAVVDVGGRRLLGGASAQRPAVAGAAVAAAGLLLGVVWWLTRITPNPLAVEMARGRAADAVQPRLDLAGVATLDDQQLRMWTTPEVGMTLHGAHTSVAVGTVALLAGLSSSSGGGDVGALLGGLPAVGRAALGLGGLACGVAVLALTVLTLRRDGRLGPVTTALHDWGWRAVVGVGVLGTALGAFGWAAAAPDLPLPAHPAGTGGALAVLAVALLAGVLLLWLAGAGTGAGLATLGIAVGALFGSGVGVLLGGLAPAGMPMVGDGAPDTVAVLHPAFAWVALAGMSIVAITAAVALLAVQRAQGREPDDVPPHGRVLWLVRELVQPSDVLVRRLGAATLLGALVPAVAWGRAAARAGGPYVGLPPLPRLAGSEAALAWVLVLVAAVLGVLVLTAATRRHGPLAGGAVVAAAVSCLEVVGVTSLLPGAVAAALWVAAVLLGAALALLWLAQQPSQHEDATRSRRWLSRRLDMDRGGLPRRLAGWGRLLAALGAALAVWVLGTWWIVERSPASAEVLMFLTLTVPFGFVVSRIRVGVGDRSARKESAVLWDLGTFWPRWFHPFSPPTYSDTAVLDLAELVADGVEAHEARWPGVPRWREQQIDLTDDVAMPAPLLLAPHSQGTVITFAALQLLVQQRVGDGEVPVDDVLADVALLTFGSPLRPHYQPMFGGQLSDASFATVRAALTGSDGRTRWRNLWRPTDPVAGPVGPGTEPGSVDGWEDVDVVDPGEPAATLVGHPPPGREPVHLVGHSDYWLTTLWPRVTAELRTLLDRASDDHGDLATVVRTGPRVDAPPDA